MIRFLLAILMVFIISPDVMAEEGGEKTYPVCQVLDEYYPANDVVYKPGVDVNGNAVVPADLNPSPFGLPDVVKVPLDINLANNIASLRDSEVQLEAPLGMMDIYQDGRVFYNGQDITGSVLTVCAQPHKIITETIIEQPKVEAQPEPKPVAPKKPAMVEKPQEVEAPKVEDVKLPAVSAPIVDPVEPPEVSEPIGLPQPLIGTPKGMVEGINDAIESETDIISGEESKDFNYNE